MWGKLGLRGETHFAGELSNNNSVWILTAVVERETSIYLGINRKILSRWGISEYNV